MRFHIWSSTYPCDWTIDLVSELFRFFKTFEQSMPTILLFRTMHCNAPSPAQTLGRELEGFSIGESPSLRHCWVLCLWTIYPHSCAIVCIDQGQFDSLISCEWNCGGERTTLVPQLNCHPPQQGGEEFKTELEMVFAPHNPFALLILPTSPVL